MRERSSASPALMPAATAPVLKPCTTIRSDTVRARVFHLEPMQSVSVLAREFVDLPFPFVELTKCHWIAVQPGQASSILEDEFGDESRIHLAERCEFFGRGRPAHLVEQGSRPPVVDKFLLHRCGSQKLFGVVEASMRDLAHESQNH